jgi:hypothetical protein
MNKLICAIAALSYSSALFACTTTIVSGAASVDGRPIIFKNADGFESWKYKYRLVVSSPAAEGKYAFVGSAMPGWKGKGGIYAGMNEKGLVAVNNTANDLSAENKNLNYDKNAKKTTGNIIVKFLSKCATVDEVEAYLKTLPVIAYGSNYGVIDAKGGAAYFECGVCGYERFDATDPKVAPKGYLIRTNFALGSRGDRKIGSGYARYKRACAMMEDATRDGAKVDVKTLIDISRSLKHGTTGDDLTKNPPSEKIEKFAYFRDFIPRHTTEMSSVFKGVKPGEDPSLTVGWFTPGNPLLSPYIPVWNKADGKIPLALWNPKGETLSKKWNSLTKSYLFPINEYHSEGIFYIRHDRLFNREGTGVLQNLLKWEKEIFTRGENLASKFYATGKVDDSRDEFNRWVDGYCVKNYRLMIPEAQKKALP